VQKHPAYDYAFLSREYRTSNQKRSGKNIAIYLLMFEVHPEFVATAPDPCLIPVDIHL